MAKLVSRTYANALFELAVEENKTLPMLEEIIVLLEVIRTNDDFSDFMNHPKIPKEEKINVVKSVFEERLCREVTGLLITVVEKDRYSDIEDILEEIIIDIKEYNHIGTAYVTTAITLTDKEKKDIDERLLATTEYEKIECSYTVDEALIGGMVIQMGDKVVDSSIRTKLGKLERELMAIQL